MLQHADADDRALATRRRALRISSGPPSLVPTLVPTPELRLLEATADPALMAGYHALRREVFVQEQGLFARHDLDAHDADPRTRVLVVIEREGRVVGGVRVHPAQPGAGPDLGWWRGSRLVAKAYRDLRAGAIGSELVRGACRAATEEGVLRFDAHVQEHCEGFFRRLGWQRTGTATIAGHEHAAMRWPVRRFADLAAATKAPIGRLTSTLLPGDGPMAAWLGDDGMPLPGTDLVACVDAILPAMVERDPEWAGWCGMLVTAHDLAAMGATPFVALDTIGARDEATLAKVVAGLRDGSQFFDLPIVGGHTQVGTAGQLTVTGLGRAEQPVAAGGGRAGDALQLTADVAGGWRPGYEGRQWDSSTHRTREEMREMLGAVRAAAPRAAKDVSMAGIVGTTGMLAEASGCGAELEVGALPRPDDARLADWLTCFPGFAMVTATDAGAAPMPAGAARSATCGTLTTEPGVRLRWPDGEVTDAIGGPVTGLGAASPADPDAATTRTRTKTSTRAPGGHRPATTMRGHGASASTQESQR